MRSFTLTRKARADIKSISIYTQKRWGKEQRSLYAKQFDDAFHLLADNPKIEIVRILHKRMDARTQLIIS